jgi:hypothetical protein
MALDVLVACRTHHNMNNIQFFCCMHLVESNLCSFQSSMAFGWLMFFWGWYYHCQYHIASESPCRKVFFATVVLRVYIFWCLQIWRCHCALICKLSTSIATWTFWLLTTGYAHHIIYNGGVLGASMCGTTQAAEPECCTLRSRTQQGGNNEWGDCSHWGVEAEQSDEEWKRPSNLMRR